MLRTLIRLLVLALLVHAGWRITPVYLNYLRFKDQLEETARFAGPISEAELISRAMDIARALDVPLEREGIRVRRDRDYTFIEATYIEVVELFPTYTYPWQFVASVHAWAVTPVPDRPTGPFW